MHIIIPHLHSQILVHNIILWNKSYDIFVSCQGRVLIVDEDLASNGAICCCTPSESVEECRLQGERRGYLTIIVVKELSIHLI